MTDLSVLIPSRCEQFLARTVQDILEHAEGNTQVIVVLDGAPADPPLPDDSRVLVVQYDQSIGQRAATNVAARLSQAKYLMKVDAHCAFDQGFDVKMMAEMQDDWTMVPIMRNLHVFDLVCPDGHRRYQSGAGPCKECGKDTTMDVVWISKNNPQSTSYCFDSEPHFRYFREFKKRPEGRGDITETMSLQGSCFMLTRSKYFDLNICDESFGSWGSQGIEVALKTWLSGGRVVCNHKTWYSHCFRTQPGFGFPYPMSGQQVEHAKSCVRELFYTNKWPKQVRPLSWLLERFWPVPGWSDEDLAKIKGADTHMVAKPVSKGLVYYSDNRLDPHIMQACQKQVERSRNGYDLVSVTLKPIDFGRNIVLDAERGYFTMFKQILAGIEASTADVLFFVEHDVVYHPSHFEFVPPRRDTFYYNENVWKVDSGTGRALFYYCRSTSGLCAYRELLLEHYRKRVEKVEREGFSRRMGFEPGTHNRPERIDDYKAESWMSPFPNIDIRHKQNLTPSRWRKDQFRNQRYTRGWTEADEVPGWGVTRGRFVELLDDIILCDMGER